MKISRICAFFFRSEGDNISLKMLMYPISSMLVFPYLSLVKSRLEFTKLQRGTTGISVLSNFRMVSARNQFNVLDWHKKNVSCYKQFQLCVGITWKRLVFPHLESDHCVTLATEILKREYYSVKLGKGRGLDKLVKLKRCVNG